MPRVCFPAAWACSPSLPSCIFLSLRARKQAVATSLSHSVGSEHLTKPHHISPAAAWGDGAVPKGARPAPPRVQHPRIPRGCPQPHVLAASTLPPALPSQSGSPCPCSPLPSPTPSAHKTPALHLLPSSSCCSRRCRRPRRCSQGHGRGGSSPRGRRAALPNYCCWVPGSVCAA